VRATLDGLTQLRNPDQVMRLRRGEELQTGVMAS
jgi:hypothetical protein